MLVLSRHVDEDVVLVLEDGRAIRVKAIAIHGDRVRIGFDAPESIKIHREEVYDRIVETKQKETETTAA